MIRSRAYLLVPILVLASSAAKADDRDKAMAEAFFRAAKEQQQKNNLGEACPKFAESHRLDPKPGTILALAVCHEAEGKTATAWADFNEALTLARRARQSDREKFAKGKMDELEKKLAYVTFQPAPELAKESSLSVSVDGKALTAAALGTKVPVDPGDHTIEARATGKLPWTTKVSIAAGPSEKAITIPNLDPEKAGDAPSAAPPPVPEERPKPPPPKEEPTSDGSTQRLLGWIAIGVGVAGIGVGGFFGMRTLSQKDDVDAHCAGSFCDAEGLDANDKAKGSATISTIGFFVGGGLAVVGAVLLLTAPSKASAASARSPHLIDF